MKLIKILKVTIFSATFLVAGFLFREQAFAIQNINMSVSPQESPYGSTNVTLSGEFKVPSWIPDCGNYGSNTYGLFPRLLYNDFRYRILNSSTGQEVDGGRYFNGPGGTGYDYRQSGYGDTIVSCPTNYQGQDPESMNFGVTKYSFNDIQIPLPNNLPAGQYEVALSWTASPGGTCDSAYWDSPEANNPPCSYYQISDTDGPGIVFYITAAPPGTVSVYSNQNTCFDVSGPTNPSSFCMSTAPDTKAYPNMQAGQYSITADDLPCYDKTIQNSTQNLVSGSSITFNIIYSSDGSCGNPDPGSINVTSNLSTSWTITGPQTYSDSGTTAVYNSAPSGTYAISAPSISGYALTITTNGNGSSSGDLIDGSSLSFNLQYSSVGSCTDNSTVALLSGLPSSLSPGQTYQFSVRISNIGSTWWYHGSAYQLQQKNTSYNMNHNGLPYGHIGSSVHTSGYLGYTDERDITFAIVAPTTPGTYNIPLQMVHNGYGYWPSKYDNGVDCGTGPLGEPEFFGQLLNVPMIVGEAPAGNSITFSITYSPSTLVAPTNVSVTHSCSSGTPTLTVNWDYTSNSAEDGFYVYRSTNDADWELVSGLLGTGVRTLQNTPPSTGIRYYYRVSTHRALDINPREAYSTSDDAMNNPCQGNLNNSTMTLTHVNGADFNGATVIKKDDVLTYKILVVNTGPAVVQMLRICGNPSSNLTSPSNMIATGVGLSNEGMQTADAGCISLGKQGLRFSVTGTKDIPNNWTITYNTVYSPITADSQEVVANSATIYFTDDQSRQKTVSAGTILVNTSTPAPPTFREVAP